MRFSLLQRLENAHDDSVWTATWSSNNVLLTGSVDESVKLWEEQDDVLQQKHVLVCGRFVMIIYKRLCA